MTWNERSNFYLIMIMVDQVYLCGYCNLRGQHTVLDVLDQICMHKHTHGLLQLQPNYPRKPPHPRKSRISQRTDADSLASDGC